MEAVVIVALGVQIALLAAVVYEIRALRKAFDALRVMASDAIGVPTPVDIIERTVHPEQGTVSIPSMLSDLQAGYDDETGEEAEPGNE
jgi:hypothetical protein